MNNKLRRKFIIFVVTVIMAGILFPAKRIVYADLIARPNTNKFYSEHESQCEVVYEMYVVNNTTGQVEGYENPESDSVVKTFENGEELAISIIYTDQNGEQWGYTHFRVKSDVISKSNRHRGHKNYYLWVPMSSLTLIEEDQESSALESGVLESSALENSIQEKKNEDKEKLVLIGSGVALLCIGTGVILVLKYRMTKH